MIRAFKIWYSDTTITGKTYRDWQNSPDEDVQVVMFYFDHKDGQGRFTRRIMFGKDYYAMNDNEKLYESFSDISKVSGHIKYGKLMDFDAFLKIKEAAWNDYGEWITQ